MHIIDIEALVIGERQRKKMDRQKLDDLKTSITSGVLLHAPVVNPLPDGRMELVAGERRCTAIKELAAEGVTFRHDGNWIMPGQLPVTYVTELTVEQLFGLELEENMMREELSWQDRIAAIAKLHAMRKEINPTQTATDTAKELAAADPNKLSVSTIRQEIATANIVAKHLDNPAVARARTANEAKEIALKTEHEMYKAELVRRKAKSVVSMTAEIQCGDLHDLLPKLDGDKFDLILSDPPYGQNADSDNYRARTVHHHNYNDSPENARKILRAILTEGWRVTKSKANLFLFTDMKHWDFLQQLAGQMGWSPWRLPIIWRKSQSEGMAGWGSKGFAHTYDIIFWATKGQKGLNRMEIDVIDEARVKRSLRTHAAEKPVALLELLIDLTTMPGDWVLDPCVGSGSTLVACKNLKRHGVGMELTQEIADAAIVRVDETKGGESYVDPEKLDKYGLPEI